MASYIDISRPVDPSMEVYPGDPPVEISVLSDPGRGDPSRVSCLRMTTHTGTHIDAPCHLGGGRLGGTDGLPLDAMIGAALVVRVPGSRVDAATVGSLPPGSAPRVLFAGDRPLTEEAARALVGRGVILVGTDSLSVDATGDERLPVHRILIDAGVVVLEALDLSRAEPGEYELIALPLLIPRSDGSPARAVLAPRRSRHDHTG